MKATFLIAVSVGLIIASASAVGVSDSQDVVARFRESHAVTFSNAWKRAEEYKTKVLYDRPSNVAQYYAQCQVDLVKTHEAALNCLAAGKIA